MSRDNFVTAIDVGSHYVITVVGTLNPEKPVPQIIGMGIARSSGMRKGMIIDIEDMTATIKRSVQEAERSSNIKLSKAFVSIGGDHILSIASRGVVAVSRADGEISNDDVDRVISAASTIALPNNREILHNIPKDFIIDGESGLRDVIGLNGLRLEANTLIIAGSSAYLKSLSNCLVDNDIEIEGFVLAPVAASKAVLSKRQKELGVLCLDIGAGTTDLAIFEDGNLIYTNIIPIGGDNITSDLAIGLRVNIDVAEQVKRDYGMALTSEVHQRDIIDLSQFDPNEKTKVSRKDIAEIMEARLREIFDLVNKQLRIIGKEAFLPGGVVLVGGSAKIPHIVDLCKSKLRLPTQIGFPREVEGIAASVDDPMYATALGLLFWGLEHGGYQKQINIPSLSVFNKPARYFKKLLRTILP